MILLINKLTNAYEFDSRALHEPKDQVQVVHLVGCQSRHLVVPLNLLAGQVFKEMYEDGSILEVDKQVVDLH